jgi:endonuclease/exonuclease/phosphatase family metal-dependent hydrolase
MKCLKVEDLTLILFVVVGKLIVVLAFVFCLSPQGSGKDSNIRVASYNLENYLTMDRMVSGRWQKDYPKPNKEKLILRSVINQSEPDILAIQEVGDPYYLNELWKDLNSTNGVRFKYSAWWPSLGEGEARHLAILSKVPFSVVGEPKDLNFKYFEVERAPSRGLLEVVLETNGVKWSLFNLHLKSKWTERPEDPEAAIRREREARVIRDYIRSKYPPYTDPNYLVVGDFNDHKNSAPLRRFLQVNNSQLTRMIPCADQQGHFWTHYWDKQDSYSRFDYILATPMMQRRLLPSSSKIGDYHLCLHASDHRMVYADFNFDQ